MTAKGAAQLQQFFSKKVPQSKKPTLREMDESALTVLMQMAAEEMGVKDLEYEELKKLTEGIMMADRPGGKEKAEEEERKAEGGVETEGLMQVEGKEVEDERDGKGEETVQAEGPMEVEDEEDKAEGIQTEGFMEVEDEDGEQGGVVLAKDW